VGVSTTLSTETIVFSKTADAKRIVAQHVPNAVDASILDVFFNGDIEIEPPMGMKDAQIGRLHQSQSALTKHQS
jgi:hypothetical protein